MNIVGLAIKKPVGVAVGVLLLVMFGLIGLGAIPVQLVPQVDRPQITVTTTWPGRSPDEIVDEITREQEDVLKNVSDLKSMRSMTSRGSAEVSLEFYVNTDLSRALQEVSDALRQVPEYPEEVNEPVIVSAAGGNSNPIAWIILDVSPLSLIHISAPSRLARRPRPRASRSWRPSKRSAPSPRSTPAPTSTHSGSSRTRS